MPNAAPESAEQIVFMAWAQLHLQSHPELALLHSYPIEGFRYPATANRLRRLGARAGVPDVFLPVARHGYHGLFIELKRTRGGRVTPLQRWWHEQLTAQGYRVVVAHGAGEAIQALESYLGIGTANAEVATAPGAGNGLASLATATTPRPLKNDLNARSKDDV